MTARKRNGIVETCRDAKGRVYYRGRLVLKDGALSPRITIPEEKRRDEKAAHNHVAFRQEAEDQTHAIYLATRATSAEVAATGETCDAWFARYAKYQRELGQTDVGTKETRWSKWISPRIGSRPITSITRDQIEDIRDVLDAAILAWVAEGKGGYRIAGKTAMNVWSCLTSAFRAASSSKRRDLRVLADRDNPCIGVEPPGDRDSQDAPQDVRVSEGSDRRVVVRGDLARMAGGARGGRVHVPSPW